MPKAPKSKRTSRKELIQAIEAERKSKVLSYVLSDRRGASAQERC
jgi:sRNA-binding carbon storage regulator CsrA